MVWNSLANANAWLPVCLNVGVLLFLCLPHSCLPQSKYSTRLVDTAYGSLRGIILPRGGNLAQDVEAFLGVPYASAPAASLRFMPPITPSHWKGVRIADKLGPVCPQVMPNLTNRSEALSKMPLLKFTRLLEMSTLLNNQSEDCLYLNIFMPKRDDRRPGVQPNIRYNSGTDANGNNLGGNSGSGGLAIVVILQGESWEWGSGNLIDGSALASNGHVMVITLNYRLGVLGFLQTSSQQGNFAIMDVVAALNWIRENAGAFGADVNRVTLLGHRTGAVLVNFLMLAPVATELFQRVILLSGSSLSPWSFQRHSKNNVRKLAQFLGCLKEKSSGGSFATSVHSSHQQGRPGGGSSSAAVSDASSDMGPCLRQIPLDQLLSAVTSQLLQPRFLPRFGPLIDATVVKSDFVAEMKIDKDGYFSSIPLLIGTASVESFGELNTEDIEDGISELKRDRILRTFVRNVFVFHLNEIYSTIKNEYTDWEKPRKDFVDVRDSILNILSDGLTVAPLIQVANIHAKKEDNRKEAKAKSYLFHFLYEADHSVYPNVRRIGSISEDLLEFSVGHALLSKLHNERSLPSYSANDAKVSKSLVQYITNFIISGDPNSGYDGSSVEDAQLPYWDSYDPINQFYLEIGGEEPRMRSHYRGHKMALWLNLVPQLHQSGGSDVTMLHHNFREEKPEFYEGAVREQQKFAVTEDPPVFQSGGGGRDKSRGQIPSDTEEDSDSSNDDYDNDGARLRKDKTGGMQPTLSPAVMSTSECPPNATNATTIVGGGGGGGGKELGVEAVGPGGTGSTDRDLVRQLAAAHYHSYGTALGVTIGVGCCLLLLNLLIFLAIYHQKTHNAPTTTYQVKEPSPEDEENPLPLPTSLTRPRSHPDVRQSSSVGGSVSFPALYSDDGTDDEDIVQELRECSTRSSSFRMKNQECSSSSGFCSPSIPEPPPPPRMRNPSP